MRCKNFVLKTKSCGEEFALKRRIWENTIHQFLVERAKYQTYLGHPFHRYTYAENCVSLSANK